MKVVINRSCFSMYLTPASTSRLLNEGLVFPHFDRSQKVRTDPRLVTLIEELGVLACNNSANPQVIEIPDGVEFTIQQDSQGFERVVENHRIWR